MQQQAQEQEETERAAALAERITEQQKAVTQARKAVAEAREEAKERLRQLGTPQRAAREEAQRTSADARYSEVQYWEDMSPRLREAIAGSAALRIGVRHRAMEQATPAVLAVGGAPVGMEPEERAKIKVEPTKEVVRMARALELAYGRFHSVIAVDASADKHEARHGGETGATASAWGAWDGVRMLGGGLPPGTGNQLGEIAAVERVLSERKAGERILLLCDCQGAMRADGGALEERPARLGIRRGRTTGRRADRDGQQASTAHMRARTPPGSRRRT